MDYLLGQNGGFWRKVFFAGLLVILADLLLFDSGFGSVIGLFALGWVALSFAAQPASWKQPWSLTAFAMAAIFGGILFYDPSFLGWVLFSTMLALAVLLPQIQGAGDGWYWFKRLAFHGFGAPFGPLLDLNRVSKAHRRPGTRMSVGHMLPNLLLPLAGTALFLGLFAMANPIIEEYLASIKFLQFEGNSIARLIFWGFVFVTVWSTLRPRRTRNMFQRLVDSEPSAIPGVTIASVTLSLALFNLLFALQNGMDLIFIWGGARLPEAFTLAEYAHRGAYPLIVDRLACRAVRPGHHASKIGNGGEQADPRADHLVDRAKYVSGRLHCRADLAVYRKLFAHPVAHRGSAVDGAGRDRAGAGHLADAARQ